MADLESRAMDSIAVMYIAASRAELIKQEEQKKKEEKPKAEEKAAGIDSETERILVTIVSTALAAIPIIAIVSKLLPEIPIYQFYQLYKYLP